MLLPVLILPMFNCYEEGNHEAILINGLSIFQIDTW